MLALLHSAGQYIRVLEAPRSRRIAEAVALIAIAALVYSPALSGPFVFDDQQSIVENETLLRLWPLGPLLAQPRDLSTSGRPLVALSFALDHARAGMDPRAFRSTNIAIHALCALLLAAVVRRTLRGPRLAERFAVRADGIAFSAALLFAVHPLASEIACYVSARTEALVALFYLATLYLGILARTSARPWGFVAGAIACSALGMASKEVMVSAPLVVALHDVVFLDRPDPRQRRVRTALWIGLATTWGLLAGLVLSQPRSESAGFSHWLTPLDYLANQCRVLPAYLKLVVWPAPLRLDYGLPDPLAVAEIWPGALLLSALLLLSLYALRRWPGPGFIGVACFAILAPSSSLLPIASEVGAERRMYLPLAALIVLLVCLGSRGLSRLGRAQVGGWLVGLALLALAVASAVRAGDHADEIALWQADVAAAPGNARARFNLSGALRRAGREHEAREERAAAVRREIAYYEQILPFQPNQAQALGDLGGLYFVAGELVRADDLYARALEVSPGDETALRMRALLRERLAPAAGDATPDD